LEQFNGEILKNYITALDGFDLLHSRFNNELIWLDLLKNYSVRRTLTSIFARPFPNEIELESIERILLAAISSLQIFSVQNHLQLIDTNYNKSYKECEIFTREFFDLESKELQILSIEYSLTIDQTCCIYTAVKDEIFLKFSRWIFDFIEKIESNIFSSQSLAHFHYLLWSIRAMTLHQVSLNSRSKSLLERIQKLMEKVSIYLSDETNFPMPKSFRMNVFIEFANTMIVFDEQKSAEKFLNFAKNNSDISFDLVGRLGLRTKFQQKPLSQLMIDFKRLKVESSNETDDIAEQKNEIAKKYYLPKDEPLDDNTLLTQIRFVNEDLTEIKQEEINLDVLEQLLIFIALKYKEKFEPKEDNLLREELLTFISFILSHCTNWVICFNSLEMRSIYEFSNRRCAERSAKQMFHLYNSLKYQSGHLDQEIENRIHHFYSILTTSYWKIEKNYADMLLALGRIESALKIYKNNNHWNEIIACYCRLNQMNEAERVIRKCLEENPEQPDLYCYLGEITKNIEHYRTAWEKSKHRCVRAAKMLGHHYFKIKDYDQALVHYRESVEADPSQTDVWFRIGYIGLIKEDWNLAVEGYRKCLQFEKNDDSFEAWNNLSKAYIKLGEKELAMRTLQEAIKHNFENWKIWENYIATCADLAEINEVIEAWNRLIDIKKSYVDDQIADILLKCVEDQTQFIPKTLKLFERVTSTSPGTAKTWQLYAKLLILAKKNERIDSETSIASDEIVKCMEKAQRQALSADWDKSVVKIIEIYDFYAELIKDFFEYINLGPIENSLNILNSLKLSTRSILIRVEKNKEDLQYDDQQQSRSRLESKIKIIDDLHKEIVGRINNSSES
ncbi:tetratricopeptide repeat protein 4, partial [Sarcoptes scabiei]